MSGSIRKPLNLKKKSENPDDNSQPTAGASSTQAADASNDNNSPAATGGPKADPFGSAKAVDLTKMQEKEAAICGMAKKFRMSVQTGKLEPFHSKFFMEAKLAKQMSEATQDAAGGPSGGAGGPRRSFDDRHQERGGGGGYRDQMVGGRNTSYERVDRGRNSYDQQNSYNSYDNQRSNYNDSRGGYNDSRGGGGGGYNDSRGGYNDSRGGGYNRDQGGYSWVWKTRMNSSLNINFG